MHLLKECPNGEFLKSPIPAATVQSQNGHGLAVEGKRHHLEGSSKFLWGSCRHWGITSWRVFVCSRGEEILLQKGIPTKLSNCCTSQVKCRSSWEAVSRADVPQPPAGPTGQPAAPGEGGGWTTASFWWWWSRRKVIALHNSVRYCMWHRRSLIVELCWGSCSLPAAYCCSPCPWPKCRVPLHGKKEGISRV